MNNERGTKSVIQGLKGRLNIQIEFLIAREKKLFKKKVSTDSGYQFYDGEEQFLSWLGSLTVDSGFLFLMEQWNGTVFKFWFSKC